MSRTGGGVAGVWLCCGFFDWQVRIHLPPYGCRIFTLTPPDDLTLAAGDSAAEASGHVTGARAPPAPLLSLLCLLLSSLLVLSSLLDALLSLPSVMFTPRSYLMHPHNHSHSSHRVMGGRVKKT